VAKPKTILAIDDELSIREAFKLILADDYNLQLAASGEAALKKIADQKIDLVFLDIRMPGLDGLESLKKIIEIDPAIKVVMVTAVNDVQKASEAIRIGAMDYIIKPFDVEQILNLTKLALASEEFKKETNGIKFKAQEKETGMIGQSEKIKSIDKTISALDKTKPVIILGPMGTEKNRIVQLIHERSSYNFGKIVEIDLSETYSLDDARRIFYGKVSGESIFTLASEKGALENANGGTLSVNNFENLPVEFIEALLNITRTHSFNKIDSFAPFPVDFNLVFTSNLGYFQISKLTGGLDWGQIIEVPALIDRPADLVMLLGYYFEQFKSHYRRGTKGFTKEALDLLTNYSWPGNTQEIIDLLKQILSGSNPEWITLKELPFKILLSSYFLSEEDEHAKLNYQHLESAFEMEWIKKALEAAKQDPAQAAKLLKITPTMLQAKIS
jgi:DNA-binding NtrC family response regulator